MWVFLDFLSLCFYDPFSFLVLVFSFHLLIVPLGLLWLLVIYRVFTATTTFHNNSLAVRVATHRTKISAGQKRCMYFNYTLVTSHLPMASSTLAPATRPSWWNAVRVSIRKFIFEVSISRLTVLFPLLFSFTNLSIYSLLILRTVLFHFDD